MQITHLLYQKNDVLKDTRNKAQNKLDAAFWQQYKRLMILTFYMFLKIVFINSKFLCTQMNVYLSKISFEYAFVVRSLTMRFMVLSMQGNHCMQYTSKTGLYLGFTLK